MYKRAIEQVKQSGLDGFLVMDPHNFSWLCQKDAYFFPGQLLLTQDAAHLFTGSRNIEAIRESYPEYEVHQGGAPAALRLCNDLGMNTLGIEGGTLTWAQHQMLTRNAGRVDLMPLMDFIEDIRLIKTPEEIALLQKATDIADKAFQLFMGKLGAGMTEIQARNIFQNLLMEEGAETLSFDVLLASGAGCFVPHATASEKVIQKGDMVLMDYGAKYRGYCSDTTRTVFIGSVDSTQKRRYELVLEAQLNAIQNIHPGITAHGADALSRDVITAREPVGCFDYGLGHGIGMENHEKPRMKPNSGYIMLEGTAVSVEPGLYIKGWGGIRIEDVIVIGKGEDGANLNLTHATKELIVI